MSLNLFPNPVLDLLNIDVNGNSSTVIITNTLGKVMYRNDRKLAAEQNIQVNVTRFPAGLYFVSMKPNSGKIVTQRFVKVRD